MSKSVTKQEKSVSKKSYKDFSPSLKDASFETHPKSLKQKFNKLVEKYRDEEDKDKRKDILDQFNEVYAKAIYIHSLDNHAAVVHTVKDTFQPLVAEMADQIIEQFDCQYAHEKALAEVAASAYVRYIQNAWRFTGSFEMEFISSEKVKLYSMFSDEADKAHRQFTTAIITLKQLKTPSPQINVNTKTAFVAQNQQLNAVQEKEVA